MVIESETDYLTIGTGVQLNAVAVSATGIAGPTGGLPGIPVGTVFIAVHSPQGTFVRHALWTNRSREDIRWRAATAALEMLRRAVLGLSQPDAAPFLFEPDASV